MNDIVVCQAQNTDNFYEIAQCIYLTDSYIYPAAFGKDLHLAACAIASLMSLKNGLFCPENLVLAFYKGKICGILLYNKEGAVWDLKKCIEVVQEFTPSIENFIHVSNTYFAVEASTPILNHIEVIACCVMPEYRNMGIGKRLLDWLFQKYSNYTFMLDVLADNPVAISLYKKCGFEIMGQFKGFSMDETNCPKCYRMFRKPQ